ncbi:MAG TPA: DUF3093 domain-containing protein [Nocardioidaceae bacterium]|nr:DUF3093 domain-containing protein [Nocardioidaceae bacterium]HET8717537.1 DUF3093 domain-containing protein [Nocardioidaceae bacterium]
MTTVTAHQHQLFEERLRVPLRWWVQATMFLASVWLAFVVALPAAIAWTASVLLALACGALFLGYGATRVRVADGHFEAGRARIPVEHLASPVALDAETTRRLAGVDANARAYLVLRPYLKRAVQVAVTDPADPTPYWLISTRHPDALVAALREADAG